MWAIPVRFLICIRPFQTKVQTFAPSKFEEQYISDGIRTHNKSNMSFLQ